MTKFGWKLKRFSNNCFQIVLQTNGRNEARVENEESRLVSFFSLRAIQSRQVRIYSNKIVPARPYPCIVPYLFYFCRAGILFLKDIVRCILVKLIFFLKSFSYSLYVLMAKFVGWNQFRTWFRFLVRYLW